jgi:cell division transport system permease protein
MSEPLTTPDDVLTDLTALPGRSVRRETPIVPRDSISGRALIAVVAIMTFLASLTVGAVLLIHRAAGEWRSEVAREATIQVRPASGRDLEADVGRAVALAKGIPGIAAARAMSKEESARLLEPFLGAGLTLDELPIPRMIVVTVDPDKTADFAQLRRALAADVPTASLDDHRSWIGRMRAMADSAVAAGVAVLVLMLTATVLSVSFATRGAMAANRPVIEVLHFVGARNGFIAGHFQRHFLILGLQGGLIGGGAAILLFALAELVGGWFGATAAGAQAAALFGTFSIGTAGYGAMVAVIVLIALVTAFTSRQTVNRTLEAID